MFTLVDCTNNAIIARHAHHSALGGLYWIQYANVDSAILSDGQNRNWSRFDAKQLISLAESVGHKLSPKLEYSELLKQTRAAVENAEQFVFPYHIDEITQQAHCISKNDDVPYAFLPGSLEPRKCESWTVGPQHNRPRCSGTETPAWPAGNAGARIPLLEPDTAPEHVVASFGRTKRKAPPAPLSGGTRGSRTSSPKVDEKVSRPKEGSLTAKVWEVADEMYNKAKGDIDIKQFRKDVIEQSIKEGINKNTSTAQFRRWKIWKGI